MNPLKIIRLFTLSYLTLLSISTFHGQSKSSLELFLTPAMQEMGNLNQRYNTRNPDYVFSNYLENPLFEAGLLYHYNVHPKFGILTGVSWRETRRAIDVEIYDSNSNSNLLFDYKNETYSRLLSFKIGCSLRLQSKVRVNLILNAEVFEKNNQIGNYHYQGEIGSSFYEDSELVIDQFNVLNLKTNSQSRKMVPEVNFHIEIVDNLSLNFGGRFRFWKSSELIHRTEITGFSGVENSGSNEVLFLTEADKREISVFAGIVYRLKFKKDN